MIMSRGDHLVGAPHLYARRKDTSRDSLWCVCFLVYAVQDTNVLMYKEQRQALAMHSYSYSTP